MTLSLSLAVLATALTPQDPAWTAAVPPAEGELPVSLAAQDPRRREAPDFGFTGAAHVRWSLPFGAAHRDVAAISGAGGALVVVDQKVSWNDLFSDGWGAEAEIDIYFSRDSRGGFGRGEGMRSGIYVSYSSDHYEGESETDDFGNRMEVEDLNMTTLLIGGKVEMPMDRALFGDGRIGLGVVHYSAVEATFSGPGVTAFRGELFEETYTLAFDARAHGGIELGPLQLVAGVGFRWLLPPSEGTNADVDSGGFMTFDLEVGAELSF